MLSFLLSFSFLSFIYCLYTTISLPLYYGENQTHSNKPS
jgi:zona occludens toxin (predicted ATPase)